MLRNCPQCGKKSVAKSSLKLAKDKILINLTCGHSFVEKPLDEMDLAGFRGKGNGHALYPYQIEAANFIAKAGGRALLTLEMGLGKTPISFVASLYLNFGRTLFVTKASLTIQTLRESLGWIGEVCQIITSPKDKLLPLKYFIMSMDMVRKFSDKQLDELPFDCIIIDECQHIKDSGSKRSVAIRKLCANKKYVIGLSATPIKNRFDEYFTILSILRPERFTGYDRFVKEWCEHYPGRYSMKIGGCSNPEGFKEATKDFIIRFTRDEVLPDLPKIRRDYRYYDLEDTVKAAYQKMNEEFSDFYEGLGATRSNADRANLLAYFAKMRHITGLSKVKNTVEFVEDFLLSYSEMEKITIFCDHVLVAEQIKGLIDNVLKDGGYEESAYLHSGLDAVDRANLVERFRSKGCRVLIASTKAAGEGLNLQFCNHCVFVERQWNPANEEQAEGRFPRPGSLANHIQATYIIALGTIDEWLTQIIEEKRNIVKSALDFTVCQYNESSILEDLALKLSAAGKRKWSY